MNFIHDLTSLAPNRMREKINELIAAMRKLNLTAGSGIKLDEHPNGTVISSRTTAAGVSSGGGTAEYNGMWKVTADVHNFTVPAFPGGNLILTEDRLYATVTEEMTVPLYNSDAVNWCYLRVNAQSTTGISLIAQQIPPIGYDDTTYLDDYIPLAIYSPENGLIQLQYGPVKLHRYWLMETSSGGGGGGGEAI